MGSSHALITMGTRNLTGRPKSIQPRERPGPRFGLVRWSRRLPSGPLGPADCVRSAQEGCCLHGRQEEAERWILAELERNCFMPRSRADEGAHKITNGSAQCTLLVHGGCAVAVAIRHASAQVAQELGADEARAPVSGDAALEKRRFHRSRHQVVQNAVIGMSVSTRGLQLRLSRAQGGLSTHDFGCFREMDDRHGLSPPANGFGNVAGGSGLRRQHLTEEARLACPLPCEAADAYVPAHCEGMVRDVHPA
mmetsp:Transcript_28300/g.51381  ORF Transcript_28300/g.51381 Transcript_28300/m.51381 type:complete len:251 (-) Transcript_28300:402-1154(-)